MLVKIQYLGPDPTFEDLNVAIPDKVYSRDFPNITDARRQVQHHITHNFLMVVTLKNYN